MKIDNFALTNWQNCPTKYQRGILQHWQPRQKSAALNYGAVIHEGLAEWYRGSFARLSNPSRLEAAVAKIREKFPLDQPPDDHRNVNKAIELMRRYADEYPGENFDILHVEVPFTLDTGKSLPLCYHREVNPDTGEVREWGCGHLNNPEANVCASCNEDLDRIEWGGILDTITSFRPVLYVLEHKTTSELGALFFRQFETSNQVTGYCWALEQLSNQRVAGAIINAMCTTRSGKISFKRETTNRAQGDFPTWKNHIQMECTTLAWHLSRNLFPHRTEHCLTKYGLCTYHGVCTLATDAEQSRALETFYERREWNHELRDVQVESAP